MTAPLFSKEEFERCAHASILDAGHRLFQERSGLKNIQIIGFDIIATFKGAPDCTAVISRKPSSPFQTACTCGFGYGTACEHVVAAMLAANTRQAIQIGIDFDSSEAIAADIPPVDPAPVNHQTGNDRDAEAVLLPSEVETVTDSPKPRLYLSEVDEQLLVDIRFAYLNGTVEFPGRDKSREKLVTGLFGNIVRLQRSMIKEMAFASRLLDAGLIHFRAGTFTPASDPVAWVRTDLQVLCSEGFEIFGRETLVSSRTTDAVPAMKLSVSSVKNGMVECAIEMGCNGTAVSLDGIFDAVIAGKKYVKLSDGSTGAIPEEWIEKLAIVFALCEEKPQSGVLRLRANRIAAVATLESIADCVSWEKTQRAGIMRLETYASPDSKPLPDTFKGRLRPYQRVGYDWFYFLKQFNLGGCLADDMGLGKTVQALTLLLNEKATLSTTKTSLLIVPTSLIFNWRREARVFAPSLLIMHYHGRDRKRYNASDISLADVVLTTYGTVCREADTFKKIRFNYIILDEAQAIKNPLSETAATVRELDCRNRLALSGTPIENNLSELWSLFSFINPGMLGSYRSFVAGFARPIEKDQSKDKAEFLRRLVAPCILRRTKGQVAKELPPKTEIMLTIAMTPHQRTLYAMTRDACRASVMQAIGNEGIDRSRMHILQALTRLRQICCHPRLVDPSYAGGSGKFDALDDLLENVVGGRHKALIFSQFVTVLDLIRGKLDECKLRYEYLTGKTANRQRPVDSFQENGDVGVMLISLKAGGVGLNLTAADYVIMFDPWWNPAVENQAADRAYRIGQTKPVFVYKLIAEDSVEQRVLELQKSKRELFDSVITAVPSILRTMKKEDVELLFT